MAAESGSAACGIDAAAERGGAIAAAVGFAIRTGGGGKLGGALATTAERLPAVDCCPSCDAASPISAIERVPAKTQRAYGGPVKPSQAEQIVVIDANRKQRLEK